MAKSVITFRNFSKLFSKTNDFFCFSKTAVNCGGKTIFLPINGSTISLNLAGCG